MKKNKKSIDLKYGAAGVSESESDSVPESPKPLSSVLNIKESTQESGTQVNFRDETTFCLRLFDENGVLLYDCVNDLNKLNAKIFNDIKQYFQKTIEFFKSIDKTMDIDSNHFDSLINSLYIIYDFYNKRPTINTIKEFLNILYDDIDKCSVYLINKRDEEINTENKTNLYQIIHNYFENKDIEDIKMKLLFINIYDIKDTNYNTVNSIIKISELIENLEKNLPENIKNNDLYKKMYVSAIFKSYIQYLLDPNKESNFIHYYINQSGGKKNNDKYIKSLKKKSTNELLNICKRYKIKSTKKINNKIIPLKDATLINKIIDYKSSRV